MPASLPSVAWTMSGEGRCPRPMLGMLKRKAEKVIVDTALRDLKKHAEA